MSLSDQEIIELHELLDALVENNLAGERRKRLEEWLAESDAARRHYVRFMDMSSSLFSYAEERLSDEDDEGVVPFEPDSGKLVRFFRPLAVAAGIAIVGWLEGARSRARGFPPTFGLGQHCRNWTRARFSSALQRSVTRVTDPCLLRTTSFTPKLVWLMLSPAHAAHRSTRRRTIAVVLRTSSTRSSSCAAAELASVYECECRPPLPRGRRSALA